jgi:hypothetical protein
VKLHAVSGENDTGEENGSGFIVAATPNRLYILTNRHVVARKDSERWGRAEKVSVTPYGQVEELAVEKEDILFFPDDGDDLAIVVVDRSQVNNFEVLTLSKRIQYGGTKVTALTYPVKETKPRITPGTIEVQDGEYYDVRFEITGRPFEGGESGSPVLNEQMLVVGIVTKRFATQEEGNANQVLNSLRIRSFLQRLNIEPFPSPENQRLALMPILFEPEKKQQKWSKQFVSNLEDFLFHLPEISTVSGQGLNNILPYVINPQAGHSLSAEELYMLPSYVVRGSGRKDGKYFILDLYLRTLPGERIIENWQVRAKSAAGLADSAGVRIAGFFGYETKFKGVPNGLRKWSLRVAVAGLVATPLLMSAVSGSQSAYEEALTSAAAESEFNTLRRKENLTYTTAMITGVSLVSWFNGQFINPRHPEFKKKEGKYLAKQH